MATLMSRISDLLTAIGADIKSLLKPAPLTPYDFGSSGPGLAVDNTTPLANLWAASVSTGRQIYLPPGDWVTKGSGGGNLPLASSMVIKGAGRQKSRLRVGSGAPSLFQWNADISGLRIEDLYLDGASSTAHLFDPGTTGGIHAAVFKNLFLNQQVDNKAIWYQDNAASYIQVTFEDCEMQRTATSTQIPFYIRNSGGGANSNQFRQVRLNGLDNVNTVFVHIESTLAQTFVSDWQFIGVIGEQNRAGLIKMVSPAGVTMIGVTDQDASGAYVADLIRFEKNANNLAPRDINLTSCTRRGSTLNAGVNEIWVDSTGKNVTLTSCNPVPTSSYATVSVPLDTTMNQMRLDPIVALNYQPAARNAIGAAGIGDLVFNVKSKDYGAKGDGTTNDTAAIQAAVDAAWASSRGGKVYLPPGNYLVTSPIVLPRNGASPSKVVTVVGAGSILTYITSSTAFPTSRGVFEWDTTVARAWGQSIAGISMRLPLVSGTRAIWFKKSGAGVTLTDFNNERFQLTLDDLILEGNNGFHPSLVKLEGQVFYSNFRRVRGDNAVSSLLSSGYAPLTDVDTLTFEFDTNLYGGLVSSDIAGESYSVFDDCSAGSLRRGGRGALLRGKIKAAKITNGWCDGGRYDPGIELINSFNVHIENCNNEGRSAAQIKLTNCEGVSISRSAPSAQDPEYPDWTASTAYTTAWGVVVPGWRAATTSAAPANNNWYACTTAGTSGSSQPTWPTTVGATVTDGTAVWTCMGPGVQDAFIVSGGRDIVLDFLMTGPGLPNFNARGCDMLRVSESPINVIARNCVCPGDPNLEINWGAVSGYGDFLGKRNGEIVRFGSDPFGLGRTDIVGQSGSVQRVNLVQNPISSATKGTFGWNTSRTSLLAQPGYFRLTINDATATDIAQRLNSKATNFQAVEPSAIRQFQAKVRSNTGLPLKMSVSFYTSANAFISSIASSAVTPDSTNFSLLTAQATTPATAAYAYIQVGISGTGARSVGQWFDVKEIFAGDPGTYFDGSTGMVDGGLTRWTGVPGDSVSYASIVPSPARLASASSTLVPSAQGVVDALSGVKLGEERIPITAFGAIGDGVTDSTAALLEAIRRTRPTRDAPTAGMSGFALKVPPGEYLLSDTINLYRWSGLFEGVGVGNSPLYASPGNASVFRWVGANDRPMFKIRDSRHLTMKHMRLESNDTTPPTYLIENNNLSTDQQGHNSNLTFEDLYLGAYTWSSQGTDKGGGVGGIGWTGDDGSNDQWYISRCFFRGFTGQALYLPNIQSIWGSIRDSAIWNSAVGIKSTAAFSGYNVAFQGCGKDVEINGSNDKPVHITDWFSEHSGQICHVTGRGRVMVSGGLWTLHSEMSANPVLRHDNAVNGSGFNIDGVYVSTALSPHPKIKMTTGTGTPGRLSIRESRILIDLATGFDLTTSVSGPLDVNLQFNDYNIMGLRMTSAADWVSSTTSRVFSNSDVEITDPTKGVILESPNNTRYRLTIGDDGVITSTVVT